jgi:hypothetical protein
VSLTHCTFLCLSHPQLFFQPQVCTDFTAPEVSDRSAAVLQSVFSATNGSQSGIQQRMPAPGDYVACRVTSTTSSSLGGTPLAIVTLQDFARWEAQFDNTLTRSTTEEKLVAELSQKLASTESSAAVAQHRLAA